MALRCSPAHLGLLALGLQQFDVDVLSPPRRRRAVHGAQVAVLLQVFVRLLDLHRAAEAAARPVLRKTFRLHVGFVFHTTISTQVDFTRIFTALDCRWRYRVSGNLLLQ